MANRISEEARKLILDDLILIGSCTGRQYVVEFVKRVYPDIEKMPNQVINDIARHMDGFNDWDFMYLFDSVIKLTKVSDEKFILFCEQYVHPIFRREHYDRETDETIDPTVQCIEAINKGLSDVGLILKPTSQTAGRDIYKVLPITQGAQNPIKNIIFAAKYKPDIVLDDALSNGVRVVDANGALIYDEGIPTEGISWNKLIEWYKVYSLEDTENNLAKRLYECLDSNVEKLFFKSYIIYMKEAGKDIPALIPQVYLYYDPKTQSERNLKIFEHQKMDFILIVSPTQRIVIEIDGQQHYADDSIAPETEYKHYASPSRYAEMMKAHREMCINGYDVYRFGGKELWVGGGLSEEDIIANNKKFFKDLFGKYRIV
ncbi:hypothetical protein [Clostridium algidicarnis]|uniref:AbiJ-related protein n=1 Tax=Clostridium algidicarnis TaxID=37659 RepID=UPI001C0AA923|nr:hypothetical protein [Clostridium algidicarnis]MBU3228787.1 hypothetical protein [Clostridium algidicarnis]MBU3252331.1 hypothetical protein [Clostridium algidicarnis]